MKIFLKILMWLILIPYLAIVIFVTACLLNYNDFNVTVFGDKSLLIIDNELDNFKKGDLVVVTKNQNNEIKVGDDIFFYYADSEENLINYGAVKGIEHVTEKESTIELDGNYKFSSQYLIGKTETSKVYKNAGTFLQILESRWGFLFLIILPILLMFIYEIYMLIIEIKDPKKS